MESRLVIWIVADGRPGHVNQSLGLAEAMGRQEKVEIYRLDLPGDGSWYGRVKFAWQQAKRLPKPDVLIGAGHRTHGVLWSLKKRWGGHSVVMMKPSLPFSFFDTCIVPEHDRRGVRHDRVIWTKGAVNRVVPSGEGKAGGLILIGGISKTHGWDGEQLSRCLAEIVKTGQWEMTDSRRTPSDWLAGVRQRLVGVRVTPHQETGADWVPKQLALAAEVWVTEDSVSMIYEALTSGARVGLLPMPRLRERSRVGMGVEAMVEAGYLTTYREWVETGKLKAAPEPLSEADRCAGLVLARLR